MPRLARLLCALAAWALAGCASVDTTVPQPVQLAPGVYMVPGALGVADGGNLGRIGNSGFIVGPSGVLAIDTGTSHAHGAALLGAIRQVTSQPVRLVLVTHTRPEFLFGGGAFRDQGIPVQTHVATARLMAARCDTCLKNLREQVGQEAMRGTALYVPDQTFTQGQALDVGGRRVELLYFGASSGPGDVAVFDRTSGVLFAGGLLDAQRIPDIQDADLPGWERALAALRALPLRRMVPGHGPASEPELVVTVGRYLALLQQQARALAERGASLLDVPDALELPEFAAWDQYDLIHRRNASIAFLRAERELLSKP